MKKIFIIIFTYLFQFTLQNNITYNTNYNQNNTVPLYLTRKSKFCHLKCDCFFSHTVKNDNICVPYWIKPSGLN